MFRKCAKTIANNSKNERRAKPVRAGNGKRVSMWSQGEHVKALLLLLLLLLIILLLLLLVLLSCILVLLLLMCCYIIIALHYYIITGE